MGPFFHGGMTARRGSYYSVEHGGGAGRKENLRPVRRGPAGLPAGFWRRFAREVFHEHTATPVATTKPLRGVLKFCPASFAPGQRLSPCREEMAAQGRRSPWKRSRMRNRLMKFR